MLDGLLNRSNFRTKCKSALNRTKTRLEVIKKKRNSVQKFLKKDIAELLKDNLDPNAYGRAEGLYTELNLTSCYEFVGQCCGCILENLKEMHKQRECPEKCKTAVSSLVYAAARFSDLPELRDLRNLFNTKYDYALEAFVSEEFVEKLKSNPPTVEMKIQLMQEIAQEFSVKWDSLPWQQQLRSQGIDKPTKTVLAFGIGAGDKMFKSMSTVAQVKAKQEDNTRLMNEEQKDKLRTRRHNSYSQFNESASQITLQELNNLKLEKIRTSTTRNQEVASENKKDDDQNLRNELGQNNKDYDDDLFSKDRPRPRSVRTKQRNSSASTGRRSVGDPQARKHEVVIVKEDEDEIANIPSTAPSRGIKASLISAEKEDNATATSVLPPPPGRRRYLFAESEVQTPRKELQAESPGGSGRSKFLPPDYQQPGSPNGN